MWSSFEKPCKMEKTLKLFLTKSIWLYEKSHQYKWLNRNNVRLNRLDQDPRYYCTKEKGDNMYSHVDCEYDEYVCVINKTPLGYSKLFCQCYSCLKIVDILKIFEICIVDYQTNVWSTVIIFRIWWLLSMFLWKLNWHLCIQDFLHFSCDYIIISYLSLFKCCI